MYNKILILTSLILLILFLPVYTQDTLYTTVNSDTLTIHHDGTERNCAALFTWDVEIVDNLITATQVDTGDQAWCMCYFDLEVSLTGLDPGSYQIDVWSDDLGFNPVFHGSLNLDWGNLSAVEQDESECLTRRDDTSFVELSVYGDTLNLFWNTPLLNCIFMPVWNGWIISDTFHVTMVDTGPPVDCICPFVSEVSFAPFPPGTYTLDFWNGEYGYPEFTISGLRNGFEIIGDYQSPCYNITGIDKGSSKLGPQKFLMGIQTYPNPFNAQIIISYQVINNVELDIQIYNIDGSLVQTLSQHSLVAPGTYELTWQGKDYTGKSVNSGVYFLVFHSGSGTSVRRLLHLK